MLLTFCFFGLGCFRLCSQTLSALALGLAQAKIIRQQSLGQHGLPAPGHLLCHQCHGGGTASPQSGRHGQHTGNFAVLIIAQSSPITNKKQGLFAIFYKLGQVSHGTGIIVHQPLMGRQVKGGAVHLGTAGIQRTEHSALTSVSSRQCFQGRDRRAERLPRERQPFDGGQTNAQPGKAAGACIDAVDVDISAGQMAEFETVVDQRHDRLAVGHARVEIALVQQAVILQQGHPAVLPAVSTARMFIALPPLW